MSEGWWRLYTGAFLVERARKDVRQGERVTELLWCYPQSFRNIVTQPHQDQSARFPGNGTLGPSSDSLFREF